jgi:ribose-phosphate pyrophosphokinase
MTPVLFDMGGSARLAARVAERLGKGLTPVEQRRFPDGEAYVRLAGPVEGDVLFVDSLVRTDETVLPLLFAAEAARTQGAHRVGLVAPYLAYMRQDMAFHEGEAVTSRTFARLLSGAFDWMVTVDPHLHRFAALGEIYSIPTLALSAAAPMAAWIGANVAQPLIVGPDSESAQWVEKIAGLCGAPHAVLAKTRRGDLDVAVEGEVELAGRTPVLVDDVISSARTMAEAVKTLRGEGRAAPICVGVHALFAGDALEVLQRAGPSAIATTDTIDHTTNRISVADEIVAAIEDWAASPPS